jgi:hypothetical protein
MTDNLRIWNRFCETPQGATKSFNKGGFPGTDINPAYRLRCLTELFGPQGSGWGWTIHERWRETYPSREKVEGVWQGYDANCAFVMLSLWWIDETGKRCECGPQIGGTEADLNVDEVWKMSITDAIGKCCVALGIAADVYLGQFDGKYRDTEPRGNYPKTPPKPPAPKCPSCGKKEFSYADKAEAGKFFCWKSKGGCGHSWRDSANGGDRDSAPPQEPSDLPAIPDGPTLAYKKAQTAIEKAKDPDAADRYMAAAKSHKEMSDIEKTMAVGACYKRLGVLFKESIDDLKALSRRIEQDDFLPNSAKQVQKFAIDALVKNHERIAEERPADGDIPW